MATSLAKRFGARLRARREGQGLTQAALAEVVDVSISGHIHNFQHIRVPDSKVDYIVNSSASKSREVVPYPGAVFGSPVTGFTLCTASESELIITFVNKFGEIIYQYARKE